MWGARFLSANKSHMGPGELMATFKELQTEINFLRAQVTALKNGSGQSIPPSGTLKGEPMEPGNFDLWGLLGAIKQGILFHSLEGKIIGANKAAENMSGFSLEELRGCKLSEARLGVVGEDKTRLDESQDPGVRAAQSGSATAGEILGFCGQRDGAKLRWVKATSIPLFRAGEDEPWQVCTLLEDISEFRQVSDKLHERMKELQAFYRMSSIAELEETPLEGLYQRIINTLPASWQYPELTCGRITIYGQEYPSNNFRESSWVQSAVVRVNGAEAGSIDILYTTECPRRMKAHSLKKSGCCWMRWRKGWAGSLNSGRRPACWNAGRVPCLC